MYIDTENNAYHVIDKIDVVGDLESHFMFIQTGVA